MVRIEEPLPWGKSTATAAVLEQLVNDRLLPLNTNPARPVWTPLRPKETEPNPPSGYIVSLVRLHERGFSVPVGRFMRALYDYYRVELHNFSPNSISQARGLRRPLRGLPRDRGTLEYVDPPVLRRALHRERAGPAEEVRPW